MAITSASPDDVITSTLWNEVATLLNGSTGGGGPVALTDYNHASTPSLKVRQQNAAGQALQIYETISAVNYDLLTVFNSSSATPGVYVGTSFYQKGPRIFDHLAFSGADEAAKINNALTYIRSNCPLGATLRLNANQIHLSAGLNASHINNLVIEAAGGPGGTFLYGSALPAAHPILDVTGSRSIEIRNVVFAGQEGDGTDPGIAGNRPSVGILIASSTTQTSNRVYLLGCGSVGFFTYAAVYGYGTSNLTIKDGGFQQDANTPTMVLTLDNVSSVTSPYQTIAPAPTNSTSDIQLRDVEIHRNDKVNAGTALVVRGVNGLTIDGQISDCYVAGSNHMSLTAVGGSYCNNIKVANRRMYKDGAGTTAGTGIYVTDRVDGLTLDNVHIQTGASVLIGGGNGAIINGLTILGDVGADGFAGTLVSAAGGAGGTLNGGLIMAGGLQINLGAGTVAEGSLVLNSGGITATGGNLATELINNVLRVPAGSVSVPSFSSSADPNSGVNMAGSDIVNLVAGGVEQGRVLTAGLAVRRLMPSTLATVLATGNFASLVGWGAGASVAAVSGNEIMGTFTISTGSATAANPTLTFTYPGGAYAAAPKVMVWLSGGSQAGAAAYPALTVTPSTGSCALQFWFTPAASQASAYTFTVLVMG